jgi:hypothetical protein
MSGELRRAVSLLVLFVLGLAAGAWVFASSWALGYAAAGGWTASMWSTVAVGAVLVVASATSLVVVLARAVHLSLRSRPDGR